MGRSVDELRDAMACFHELRTTSAAPLITPAVRQAAVAQANLQKTLKIAKVSALGHSLPNYKFEY